jgi:hypothetical protein
MSLYLDDVIQRHPQARAIEFPIESLTVVACRARIRIGSQGWVERAARVVEQYRQQQEAA